MEKLQTEITKFCTRTTRHFYDLKLPVIQLVFLKAVHELIDLKIFETCEIKTITAERLNKYITNFSKLKMQSFKDADLDFLIPAIECLNKFDFSKGKYFDEDVITHVYNSMCTALITGSAHAGYAEYNTPDCVTNLISKILGKPKNEATTLYDPCCGTGATFIPFLRDNWDKDVAVYGQDINQESIVICRMNVYLQQLKNKIKQIKMLNNG